MSKGLIKRIARNGGYFGAIFAVKNLLPKATVSIGGDYLLIRMMVTFHRAKSRSCLTISLRVLLVASSGRP